MFQRFKKGLHVLFIIFLGVVLLNGCDINKAKDAFKKVNVVIGLKPITTTVSGQFLDAKTRDLIPKVTLSFIGNGAGDVIDMYSDHLSQQTFKGGFATFGISNSSTPTITSPESFTIKAEAPGYVTSYQKVILTDTTHYSFIMTMTKRNNLPAGVTVGNNNTIQAASDGTVSQGYTVKTRPTALASSIASLSIPANTVITDASGNPLNGTLKTHIMYYADSLQATRQLPGGFSEGKITLGFTRISITDASGNEAAKFSKPVALQFEVSSKMKNPVTGNYYKSGDSLEVGSYNENTGQWSKEGMVYLNSHQSKGKVVTSVSNPHYFISYRFTKLSKNKSQIILSLFARQLPPSFGVLGAEININRNGNAGPLRINIVGTYNSFFEHRIIAAGKNKFMIFGSGQPYVPDILATIYYFQNINSSLFRLSLGSFSIAKGSYTITLPPPDYLAKGYTTVAFNLHPQCSDPGKKIIITNIPTSEVYYSETGSHYWYDAGEITWEFDKQTNVLTGQLNVSGLIPGKTYIFVTDYDGKTYTKDITINGSTMNLSQTISGGFCK